MKGARIGIPRAFYYDRVTLPAESTPRGGLNAEQAKAMADAIAVLKQQGAVVVDPADVPSFVDKDPKNNFLLWDYCSGAEQAKGKDANCSVNFKYGMKRDFNLWLKSLGPSAPVKTLTELRAVEHHAHAKPARSASASHDWTSPTRWTSRPTARATTRIIRRTCGSAATNGIDGVLKAASSSTTILTPGGAGAGLAARAGYPIIVVPFGMVPNAPTPAFPAGFDAKPAPFGVGFTGTACSEPRLIELAYAFEQATRKRVRPPDLP